MSGWRETSCGNDCRRDGRTGRRRSICVAGRRSGALGVGAERLVAVVVGRSSSSCATAGAARTRVPGPATTTAVGRADTTARWCAAGGQQHLPAARAAARDEGRAPTRAAKRCPRSTWKCANSIARFDRRRCSSSAPTATGPVCSPDAASTRQCIRSTPMSESEPRRLGRTGSSAPPNHGWPGNARRSRTTSSANWRATVAATVPQEARARCLAKSVLALFGGEEGDGPHGRRPTSSAPAVSPPTARSASRLCDGYYFPVSFSTLPEPFPARCRSCQSQCAARPNSTITRTPAALSNRWCRPCPAAVHELEIGVPLPEGIRAGVLVQAGRIQAVG